MRSDVTRKDYRLQILHEVAQEIKNEKLPNALINEWAYKDICETVLRLGGLVNQLYRKLGTIAVTSNAGYYDATATHVASSVTVSGFSGLTPDAWIGGTVMCVSSNVFYAAQITDNDATTLTISVGTDLPALSGEPVFMTANNSGNLLDLSSLSMINYQEPVWCVIDPSGNMIPQMNIDRALSIKDITEYDDETYWYLIGQSIALALGADATASGDFQVGYYELPTEPAADTNYIDLPLEWHDLAQQKTMIRILKKVGNDQAAKLKEVDLEERYQKIATANAELKMRDIASGERI